MKKALATERPADELTGQAAADALHAVVATLTVPGEHGAYIRGGSVVKEGSHVYVCLTVHHATVSRIRMRLTTVAARELYEQLGRVVG